MQSVPIQAIPNQAFSIILNNNEWDITLKTTNGVLSASMSVNGADILDGYRVVAGAPLIPSIYLENGNFMFVTEAFQLPNYELFNLTQQLLYFSPGELAIYRAPVTPPITQADFNPIGALPLRFAPQGYT